MSAGGGRRPHEAAFTLVEMLVVLAIIIMVTAMTIPMLLPFMEGRKLEQGTEMVKTAAVLARSRAVETKHRVTVTLIEEAKTVVVNDYEQLRRMLPVRERGTVTAASTQTALERSSSTVDLTGYTITMISGAAFGAQRVIGSVSGTTINLLPDYPLANVPAAGDEYVIGGRDPATEQALKYVCPHYLTDNYLGADDTQRAAQRHELLMRMSLITPKVLPEGVRFDLDDEPADGTDPEVHGWTYVFQPAGSVWTLTTLAENKRNAEWSRTTYMVNNDPSGPRMYGPMERESAQIVLYAMTGQVVSE